MPQHRVARGMADGVVDVFEVVEVANDQRERLLSLFRSLQLAI
jgi:hypothetical protein